MKRITARVRHGRRQQHINLPPSGWEVSAMAEEKTAAARHSADYRARQKKQAAKLGIEKMFFNMPEGIKAAMAAEIDRHGYDQVQELWQDLALSWISQDPEERARRLERPDAPAFYISPKLARQFEEASMTELRRDPGDEIETPKSI